LIDSGLHLVDGILLQGFKDNAFMHFTNNAVQKFSEGYGWVADGNQLSFK
jgi:hypothetical protein